MRATAEKIEAAIGDAFHGDAHAFLVAIYKDPRQDVALRVDAAKMAIRYEKPALASAKLEFKDPLAEMTEDDLSRLVNALEQSAAAHEAHRGQDAASDHAGDPD